MNGYQRGQQAARKRYGIPDPQPTELDALPPTGLNRGRLAAIARTSSDPAERRNAAAILQRWQTAPPAADDGDQGDGNTAA